MEVFYQAHAASLWLGLAIATIVIFAWLALIQMRLGRLEPRERGSLTPEASQTLSDCLAQVTDLRRMVETLGEDLDRSLQSFGIVRFNPFPDMGGDQSFSIALADAQGNGLVISSLYGRTVSRVYAKPLRNWDSPYTLTDEEKEAIARARSRVEGHKHVPVQEHSSST